MRRRGPDACPALSEWRSTFHPLRDVLHSLLKAAPPGQIGWNIPLDPALAPLREHAAFEPVLARLGERAV